MDIELKELRRIASAAGRAIMAHYAVGQVKAARKRDSSPVTAADLEADRLIQDRLRRLYPGIPCISEESPLPPFAERRGWSRFWLVDPLDGTKEFLNRNGEFTVNIALIDRGAPVMGVVLAPAKDVEYFASIGSGTWKRAGARPPERVFSRAADERKPLTVVESRSHPSPELERFLSRFEVKERVRAGSSLKFGLVAEGTADIYPRMGPTMEWDVAAGDCVYRCSARSGSRYSSLRYNKESLKNDRFVIGASSDSELQELSDG